MIIQCTSCQTRFRVPDDKVSDKPVKVRCSKCKAVFPITRDQGQPETAGPAASPSAASMPAAAASTSRPASGSAARAKPAASAGSMPAAKTGRSGPLGAIKPAAPPPNLAKPIEGTLTRPPQMQGLGVTLPSVMPPADPFAAFDPADGPTGEPTTPFHYPAGINATRPPPGTDVVPKLNEFKVPADPFANLDLGSLGGGAPLTPPAAPAPLRPTESDPFANLELSAPGIKSAAVALVGDADPFAALSAPEPAPLPAPAPAPVSDPFANLQFTAPEPASAPPPSDGDPFAHFAAPAAPAAFADPAAASTQAESDPFANLDLGALVAKPGGAPAPRPPSQATPAVRPRPEPQAVTEVASLPPASVAAPPPLPSASSSPLDDFFGDAEAPSMPAASAGSGSYLDQPDEPSHPGGTVGASVDRSLFDLPPPPPPSSMASPMSISASYDSSDESSAPRPALRAPPPKPAAAPEPSAGARWVSTAFNILLVGAVTWGALVGVATFRNDGRFDSTLLRPRELLHALVKTETSLASQLHVEDVTNGLYTTTNGRQVFYVRGQVTNHGKTALGPAELKVDVLDGDKVLASGSGWAGSAPTPEKIFALTDAAAAAALIKQMKAEAQPVAPGASKPFVAILFDYPEDLATRALRVTAELPTAVASAK